LSQPDENIVYAKEVHIKDGWISILFASDNGGEFKMKYRQGAEFCTAHLIEKIEWMCEQAEITLNGNGVDIPERPAKKDVDGCGGCKKSKGG
jgi:hypothetical protein